MSGFAKYKFVLCDTFTGEVIEGYDWHKKTDLLNLVNRHIKDFVDGMAVHETLCLSLKIEKEQPLNENILKIEF